MDKLRKLMQRNISDATGFSVVAVPSNAILETLIPPGVSDLESMKTRGIVMATLYLGLGRVIAKNMDWSRGKFHLDPEKDVGRTWLHDAGYTLALTMLVNPPIYYLSGVHDTEDLFWKTLEVGVLAVAAGGAMGYCKDVFGELAGLQPRKRLSENMYNAPIRTRRAVMAGIVATSIALTTTIYSLPNYQSHNQEKAPQDIEQIVSE
ncbi:MAG: hypothetical protein ABIA93_05360 [Candidatus Woesearchaeota archaeon]